MKIFHKLFLVIFVCSIFFSQNLSCMDANHREVERYSTGNSRGTISGKLLLFASLLALALSPSDAAIISPKKDVAQLSLTSPMEEQPYIHDSLSPEVYPYSRICFDKLHEEFNRMAKNNSRGLGISGRGKRSRERFRTLLKENFLRIMYEQVEGFYGLLSEEDLKQVFYEGMTMIDGNLEDIQRGIE